MTKRKKIVIIPLDERPCNYDFNQFLTKDTDYNVVLPSRDILGNKKVPGNTDALIKWLKEESKDAFGVVISVDTLLYGGIVPSRLHHDSEEVLLNRLNEIRHIKGDHKELKIFAFQLIMRSPKYSSSEEEPDYYADYGRELHLNGVYEHKTTLGIITPEETAHYEKIKKEIPKVFLDDYMTRRDVNSKLNKHFLKLAEDNIIDFGIVPMDDSSPYGYTAIDTLSTLEIVEQKELDFKVFMYPGADEITNVLVTRMILQDLKLRPTFYVKYSSVGDGKLIPLYEDRYLAETLKYHVLTSGGIIIEDLKNADIVLLVNTPPENMREAGSIDKRTIEYDSFRTLIEYVEFAEYSIKVLKKPTLIADVAYANGGDKKLLKLLKLKELLYEVSGYAGWNTASNTMGTVIPMGIMNFLYPQRTKAHLDFLALRYIEDVGYCSIVRKKIGSQLELPIHYYQLDGKRGRVVDQIRIELEKFIEENLNYKDIKPVITDIYSPWNRMFETGLKVDVGGNKKE